MGTTRSQTLVQSDTGKKKTITLEQCGFDYEFISEAEAKQRAKAAEVEVDDTPPRPEEARTIARRYRDGFTVLSQLPARALDKVQAALYAKQVMSLRNEIARESGRESTADLMLADLAAAAFFRSQMLAGDAIAALAGRDADYKRSETFHGMATKAAATAMAALDALRPLAKPATLEIRRADHVLAAEQVHLHQGPSHDFHQIEGAVVPVARQPAEPVALRPAALAERRKPRLRLPARVKTR